MAVSTSKEAHTPAPATGAASRLNMPFDKGSLGMLVVTAEHDAVRVQAEPAGCRAS